jgi:glycosyltransferase involved in cell wall biosynthesis
LVALKSFVRLAAGFQRAGIDQRIVVRPNGSRNPRLKEAGFKLTELPFGGLFDRRTVPALASEIDQFEPDIVLSWMNRASVLTGKALAKSSAAPPLIGRLGGYYDLKYYAGCDHLVGNTPDIVRYILDQRWPKQSVHFVPNFVSEMAGTQLPRHAFNVPDDALLVLAAGRLHQNKAFDTLLTAMKNLPGVYLILAGDGVDARKLESLALKIGIADRVRFLGWRTDMSNLMATVDLLICPSRIEPLGNVVIEAWACNVPVVAAASDGPAWLINEGEDGILVPVDEPDLLSDAIRSLAEDPAVASRLVAAGRKRYEEEFTEAAIVAQYLDLFERVRS